MEKAEWFYIRHVSSNKVVSIRKETDTDDLLRSQVFVTEPKYTDDELWCWDEHRLKSKSTNLVLDIRKGKLRLIEDTDICLYHKKPDEEAQNQLWAIRQNNEGRTPTEHPLTCQKPLGGIIYSMCSSDWVLDVGSDGNKLILFPYHGYYEESITQYWALVPEKDMNSIRLLPLQDDSTEMVTEDYTCYHHDGSLSSVSSDSNSTNYEFAHGLRPAKRSSGLSLSTLAKEANHEYHQFQHYSLN